MAQYDKGMLIEVLNSLEPEVLQAILPDNILDAGLVDPAAVRDSTNKVEGAAPLEGGVMLSPTSPRPTTIPPPEYISIRQVEIFGGRRASIEYTLMEEVEIPYSKSNLDKTIAYSISKRTVADGIVPDHEYNNIQNNPASSMSVKVQHPSIVIFMLKAPMNVFFSQKGTPFSFNPNLASECFYESMRVTKVGRQIDTHDNGATDVKNCRLAYMYVNPKDYGAAGKFAPFNIHLDLIGTGITSNYRIPIIIDPDVRYPGGSGP